jgi:tetratricopeptide (TPR) repeat protein
MGKNKLRVKFWFFSILILCSCFLVAGCADIPVYQPDFTNIKQPQMSCAEALYRIRTDLQAAKIMNEPGSSIEDIQVTGEGITFKDTFDNSLFSIKFNDVQSLILYQVVGMSNSYYILLGGKGIFYTSQGAAQDLVDNILAIKYYQSVRSLNNDAAFEDFQQKANIWRALSQKPFIPEEVHRFIVLKDDAIQNNEFDKAADYYEQALAIDPMWPAGQYNVALIYEQLKVYPMAVMHMKRYLALEPDAANARAMQDKIYLWEEKAKEGDDSAENTNAQSAQTSNNSFGLMTGK